MKYPSVLIVILNWNSKEDTLLCIESIKKTDYPRYDILVIDNASSDDSAEKIKNTYPDITLVKNHINEGFAKGMNIGMKYSLDHSYGYTLVMNNDVVVDKSFLTHLIETGESEENIGIIGPKVYNYKSNIIQTVGVTNIYDMLGKPIGLNEIDNGQFDRLSEVDAVYGCVMLIKNSVLRRIGLFDPQYYMYYEDTDLCMRAKKIGYYIHASPKSIVWHKGLISTNKVKSTIQFYISRNKFIFVKKYYNFLNLSRFLLKFFIYDLPISTLTFLYHRELKTMYSSLKGNIVGLIILVST